MRFLNVLRRLSVIVALVLLAAPNQAAAFCGFYVGGGDAKLFNDATQVVLMRHEKTTVLAMQNKYEGPVADFAMVVPVPQVLQKENVKTLKKELFDRVDTLSAPRLVEYWERDPCNPRGIGSFGTIGRGFGGLGASGFGRGGGGRGGFVKVRSQFEVGEYEVSVLETNDATTLDTWLKDNKYKIPAGAGPYFKPYIEAGNYFFVAKVNAKKVKYKDGSAVLSPLRFHYQSDEFSLPIRLGMINSKGEQDLLVYLLSPNQRYEVANYPNVTIPTNIEVGPKIKGNFGEFYEALLSRTFEENPKAVVTEYAWAAQKCDPCPSGIRGGAALRLEDLNLLGNDIVNFGGMGRGAGWVLTRLHARYAKDGVGKDLVFQKAAAIVGGREMRNDDGSLEKGSADGSANNFQGRYIIRNEWEGETKCDNPVRGIWSGPPNAHEMKITAEAIVNEFRRAKAAEQGREPNEKELAAPWSDAERKAVAYQLRKKYGTSEAPASADGPVSAPSANTRGAGVTLGAGFSIAGVVKEAIPELKIVPNPAEAPATPDAPAAPEAGSGEPAQPETESEPDKSADASAKPLEANEPPKSGCAAVDGVPSGFMLLFVAGWILVRRRNARDVRDS